MKNILNSLNKLKANSKIILSVLTIALLLGVGVTVWAFTDPNAKEVFASFGAPSSSSNNNNPSDQNKTINPESEQSLAKKQKDQQELQKQLETQNKQYANDLESLQAKIDTNNKAISDLEANKNNPPYTTETKTVPGQMDYIKSADKVADDNLISEIVFAEMCMKNTPETCNEKHKNLYNKYGSGNPRPAMFATWAAKNTKIVKNFDEAKYNQDMQSLQNTKTELDKQKIDLDKAHQSKIDEINLKLK